MVDESPKKELSVLPTQVTQSSLHAPGEEDGAKITKPNLLSTFVNNFIENNFISKNDTILMQAKVFIK